ncbi:hypothetical protein D3C78_829630 [compost metagenome]
MKYELTIEQRDQIMELLTSEQKHFIHHSLVRGRRTLFARQLARKKCQFIPEDAQFEDIEALIEEWDYIGFTDSGEVSPHTKCECGRSLRYQHQVLHLPTNTMRYFGIEHLQLHTGIDAKAISAILKGFDVLDEEMNEVLCKFRDSWQLDQHIFLPLPDELDIPQDIAAQMDVQLPLLDRQLARLRSRMRELEHADRQRRIEAALTYVNPSGSLEQASQSLTRDLDEASIEPSSPSFDEPSFQAASAPVTEQAAFSLELDGDGQASFDFSIEEEGQAAFVFDEPGSKQSVFTSELQASGQRPAAADAADNKTSPAASGEAVHGSSGVGYMPTSSNPFHLPPSARRVIDDALPLGGRISTRAMSEFIIEQKLVHDVRMSTGKPSIYIAVAAYLDKLTETGRCELTAASAEDRVYAPL